MMNGAITKGFLLPLILFLDYQEHTTLYCFYSSPFICWLKLQNHQGTNLVDLQCWTAVSLVFSCFVRQELHLFGFNLWSGLRNTNLSLNLIPTHRGFAEFLNASSSQINFLSVLPQFNFVQVHGVGAQLECNHP